MSTDITAVYRLACHQLNRAFFRVQLHHDKEEANQGNKFRFILEDDPPYYLTASPDAQILALLHNNQIISSIQVENFSKMNSIMISETNENEVEVNPHIAWSPNSHLVAHANSSDLKVRIFGGYPLELLSNIEIRSIGALNQSIIDIKWRTLPSSSNTSELFLLLSDGQLVIFRVSDQTGEMISWADSDREICQVESQVSPSTYRIFQLDYQHSLVNCMDISEDGKVLAIGTRPRCKQSRSLDSISLSSISTWAISFWIILDNSPLFEPKSFLGERVGIYEREKIQHFPSKIPMEEIVYPNKETVLSVSISNSDNIALILDQSGQLSIIDIDKETVLMSWTSGFLNSITHILSQKQDVDDGAGGHISYGENRPDRIKINTAHWWGERSIIVMFNYGKFLLFRFHCFNGEEELLANSLEIQYEEQFAYGTRISNPSRGVIFLLELGLNEIPFHETNLGFNKFFTDVDQHYLELPNQIDPYSIIPEDDLNLSSDSLKPNLITEYPDSIHSHSQDHLFHYGTNSRGASFTWILSSFLMILIRIWYFLFPFSKRYHQRPYAKPTLRRINYKLFSFTETSPLDIYIANIETRNELLAENIVKRYHIDADSMLKRKWLAKHMMNLNSNSLYLNHIQDRLWVLGQCLNVVLDNEIDMKALLEYGMNRAIPSFSPELSKTFTITLLDRQILLMRLLILRYLDRLKLYLKLNGSLNYEASVFLAFRSTSLVKIAMILAQNQCFKELSYIWTFYGPITIPWKFVTLQHIPEGLDPNLYRELLPSLIFDWNINDYHVKEWAAENMRDSPDEWCETFQMLKILGLINEPTCCSYEDLDVQEIKHALEECEIYLNTQLPRSEGIERKSSNNSHNLAFASQDDKTYSFFHDIHLDFRKTCDVHQCNHAHDHHCLPFSTSESTFITQFSILETPLANPTIDNILYWYQTRASHIDAITGFIQNALNLCYIGFENGLHGLSAMITDLEMLHLLVYECGQNLSLKEFKSLDEMQRFFMVLDYATPDKILDYLLGCCLSYFKRDIEIWNQLILPNALHYTEAYLSIWMNRVTNDSNSTNNIPKMLSSNRLKCVVAVLKEISRLSIHGEDQDTSKVKLHNSFVLYFLVLDFIYPYKFSSLDTIDDFLGIIRSLHKDAGGFVQLENIQVLGNQDKYEDLNQLMQRILHLNNHLQAASILGKYKIFKHLDELLDIETLHNRGEYYQAKKLLQDLLNNNQLIPSQTWNNAQWLESLEDIQELRAILFPSLPIEVTYHLFVETLLRAGKFSLAEPYIDRISNFEQLLLNVAQNFFCQCNSIHDNSALEYALTCLNMMPIPSAVILKEKNLVEAILAIKLKCPQFIKKLDPIQFHLSNNRIEYIEELLNLAPYLHHDISFITYLIVAFDCKNREEQILLIKYIAAKIAFREGHTKHGLSLMNQLLYTRFHDAWRLVYIVALSSLNLELEMRLYLIRFVVENVPAEQLSQAVDVWRMLNTFLLSKKSGILIDIYWPIDIEKTSDKEVNAIIIQPSILSTNLQYVFSTCLTIFQSMQQGCRISPSTATSSLSSFNIFRTIPKMQEATKDKKIKLDRNYVHSLRSLTSDHFSNPKNADHAEILNIQPSSLPQLPTFNQHCLNNSYNPTYVMNCFETDNHSNRVDERSHEYHITIIQILSSIFHHWLENPIKIIVNYKQELHEELLLELGKIALRNHNILPFFSTTLHPLLSPIKMKIFFADYISIYAKDQSTSNRLIKLTMCYFALLILLLDNIWSYSDWMIWPSEMIIIEAKKTIIHWKSAPNSSRFIQYKPLMDIFDELTHYENQFQINSKINSIDDSIDPNRFIKDRMYVCQVILDFAQSSSPENLERAIQLCNIANEDINLNSMKSLYEDKIDVDFDGSLHSRISIDNNSTNGDTHYPDYFTVITTHIKSLLLHPKLLDITWEDNYIQPHILQLYRHHSESFISVLNFLWEKIDGKSLSRLQLVAYWLGLSYQELSRMSMNSNNTLSKTQLETLSMFWHSQSQALESISKADSLSTSSPNSLENILNWKYFIKGFKESRESLTNVLDSENINIFVNNATPISNALKWASYMLHNSQSLPSFPTNLDLSASCSIEFTECEKLAISFNASKIYLIFAVKILRHSLELVDVLPKYYNKLDVSDMEQFVDDVSLQAQTLDLGSLSIKTRRVILTQLTDFLHLQKEATSVIPKLLTKVLRAKHIFSLIDDLESEVSMAIFTPSNTEFNQDNKCQISAYLFQIRTILIHNSEPSDALQHIFHLMIANGVQIDIVRLINEKFQNTSISEWDENWEDTQFPSSSLEEQQHLQHDDSLQEMNQTFQRNYDLPIDVKPYTTLYKDTIATALKYLNIELSSDLEVMNHFFSANCSDLSPVEAWPPYDVKMAFFALSHIISALKQQVLYCSLDTCSFYILIDHSVSIIRQYIYQEDGSSIEWPDPEQKGLQLIKISILDSLCQTPCLYSNKSQHQQDQSILESLILKYLSVFLADGELEEWNGETTNIPSSDEHSILHSKTLQTIPSLPKPVDPNFRCEIVELLLDKTSNINDLKNFQLIFKLLHLWSRMIAYQRDCQVHVQLSYPEFTYHGLWYLFFQILGRISPSMVLDYRPLVDEKWLTPFEQEDLIQQFLEFELSSNTPSPCHWGAKFGFMSTIPLMIETACYTLFSYFEKRYGNTIPNYCGELKSVFNQQFIHLDSLFQVSSIHHKKVKSNFSVAYCKSMESINNDDNLLLLVVYGRDYDAQLLRWILEADALCNFACADPPHFLTSFLLDMIFYIHDVAELPEHWNPYKMDFQEIKSKFKGSEKPVMSLENLVASLVLRGSIDLAAIIMFQHTQFIKYQTPRSIQLALDSLPVYMQEAKKRCVGWVQMSLETEKSNKKNRQGHRVKNIFPKSKKNKDGANQDSNADLVSWLGCAERCSLAIEYFSNLTEKY